jgi:hypothetical protein
MTKDPSIKCVCVGRCLSLLHERQKPLEDTPYVRAGVRNNLAIALTVLLLKVKSDKHAVFKFYFFKFYFRSGHVCTIYVLTCITPYCNI